MLTIERRFNERIKEHNQKSKEDIIRTKEELKNYNKAVQRFTTGSIFFNDRDYECAFCSYCFAAIMANEINEKELTSKSLDEAERSLNYLGKFKGEKFLLERLEELKEGLLHIPDKRIVHFLNELSGLS